MTFQQVTLVVPLGPNVPGISVSEYDGNLAVLELALVRMFGGWTAVDGHGAWEPGPLTTCEGCKWDFADEPEHVAAAKDSGNCPNCGRTLGDTLYEPVRVYTLATGIEITFDDLAILRQRVKVLLDQRAVYLAAYDLAEKPIQ